MPEFEEFALNPLVAPARILPNGISEHELLDAGAEETYADTADLLAHLRASRLVPLL